MSDAAKKIFDSRRLLLHKLIPYGFEHENGAYTYKKAVGGGFVLSVFITPDGSVDTKMTDSATGGIYTLHLDDNATGSFVGSVRSEYEDILTDISLHCFEPFVFKAAQSVRCIDHVREKYGDELEFLWEKFAGDAVWRRKDNRKWYAVLLTVSAEKLGISKSGTLEIIDLRMEKTEKETLMLKPGYLPGYHMNKNSWFSIVLDGSVDDGELFDRIEKSYALAGKKNGKGK